MKTTRTVVAHYDNCYRDYAKDCNSFADCICIQLVDDKACNIAKQIFDAYEKTKPKDE